MAHMQKHRLLFAKTDRACYISHLDLMRTFPRAFLRAGLHVKQTEGFNQHSFVSIALPLSLGYSSRCEILEFELLDPLPLSQIPERMNRVLPEGIVVLDCYEAERPCRSIRYLRWECRLCYDHGIPADASDTFLGIYKAESLVIEKPSKKAKKGYTELDLIPLIHSLDVEEVGTELIVHAVLAAQNPGLNPELLISTAVARCPQIQPDFVSYERCEVLDENLEIFR